MLAVASLLTTLYAVINALGAWAVIRRKGWLAALFMLAASVLVLAAVALVSDLPFTRALLAVGLLLASLASLLYASVVVGRVRWSHHVIRLLLAIGLFALAHYGLSA